LKKLSVDEFILKSIEKYGDKYDYSLVNYIDTKTKVSIICPNHGIFEIEPYRFLSGRDCVKCKKDKFIYIYKNNFILKSTKIHNGFYDYSLVEYINNNIKVKIICPIHGVFEQVPMNHIKGIGCSKCTNNNKMTNIYFIEKSNIKHNNFYDYSLVEYVNAKTKVKIICPTHGVFDQTPNSHLNGQGCSKCKGGVHKDINHFITKSNKIHDHFYDYSLVEYINAKTKVKIICPIHGVFEQNPHHHLNGHGCVLCSNKKSQESQSYSVIDFLNLSNKKYNSKYDYSLIEYINMFTKIKIICPIHGIFEQSPRSHLMYGCPKCKKDILSTSNGKKFIKFSTKKYDDKYDYSLVEYTKSYTPVKIICPIHGVFEQTPQIHKKCTCGCPECANINVRLKFIKKIEFNKNNGYQITPSFNKYACEVFDKISINENKHIQHAMNGGEYYIKELGYWLDGYDKINNIVYEFDEKFHFDKNGILRDKDIIRQKEIEFFLKCEFIRIKYNDIT